MIITVIKHPTKLLQIGLKISLLFKSILNVLI